MRKKDNNKNSFPDLVTFVGLSDAVEVPRQTLILWHKILRFPAVIPVGNVQKYYPLAECTLILKLFRAEQARGFKRDFAAENVRNSKQMKAIAKTVQKKYSGAKIIL